MRILSLFLALALSISVIAQPGNPPTKTPAKAIDASIRSQVIEAAIKKLHENYVFPEVAKQMESAIRARQERKDYDQITNPIIFANTLTDHLREVSKDKHLSVRFTGGGGPNLGGGADREQYRMMASKRNFGFEKVERLGGNIGYLDFRGFEDPEFARETAAAAMSFLANTDALIIDLRQNGGGDPAMVAFVSSYLFDKRTHLNDIYERPGNQTEEFWTKENVPGKKFGGEKPVFVLTSKYTFSGAEEFSYNLKNLKRATIIGEVTGGGAHPVSPHKISEDFVIGVPFARAINPITKTNWEGVGVKPDIEVAAAQSLKTAHLAALKAVEAKNTDSRLAGQLKSLIGAIQHELDEMKAPTGSAKTQSSTGDELALPNTPAGKTLEAFVKALNTGKIETMRKFHQDHGGNPENAEQDMGFFQQSGGLKLHSIKRSSETEIEVLVQTKKASDWIAFQLNVESAAPHNISEIRIQPASAPK